jgi:hypothetical protein
MAAKRKLAVIVERMKDKGRTEHDMEGNVWQRGELVRDAETLLI